MPPSPSASNDTTAYLQVRGASKNFGDFAALQDVSFDILQGEFICFLGPSGCGKTTLLRCIAGLESLSTGQIIQGGVDVTKLPTSQRDFGIVFQSYALFPNLSIIENVAFGLLNSGRTKAEISNRVAELLELVGLSGQEDKYPGQLSGGQQQRVALARALAPSPGLLLLDEPLSALDAKVRVRLRREIKRLQRQVGVTTIMVTHDQEEALTMADRVLVMRGGRLEQMGSPNDIYDCPATPFVADFIGTTNLLRATAIEPGLLRSGSVEWRINDTAWPTGSRVLCSIRPEHVNLSAASDTTADAQPYIHATVIEVERQGGHYRLHLRTSVDPPEIAVDLHESDPALNFATHGLQVLVHLPAQKMRLFGEPT
ncbi:MAG: putative 2-aminoethylphosphonate ABC transporter ATP-binding protein [Pseudomonadales bacterium]